MVTLGRSVLSQYHAFTRYNSPFPAHDDGRAIDLYPPGGAPSPVAGTVVDTLTVGAPSRDYAEADDHLIVIETGDLLARLLHVDPAVAVGERVDVGDELGRLVRSGYFAPWVDNHIHLGFRPSDADPVRAAGSLPIDLAVTVRPVSWNGHGIVVERESTYVVLDAPGHPDPGNRFAGIADSGAVIDGGIPHYQGGGLIAGTDGPVFLAGTRVGEAAGRTITWDPIEIRANGRPVTGVSLACYRDRLGVKLVSWDGFTADLGDEVEVSVHRRAGGPMAG